MHYMYCAGSRFDSSGGAVGRLEKSEAATPPENQELDAAGAGASAAAGGVAVVSQWSNSSGLPGAGVGGMLFRANERSSADAARSRQRAPVTKTCQLGQMQVDCFYST